MNKTIGSSHQDNKQECIQLVVFRMGKELYGLSITGVQEIVGVPSMTRVPGMPDAVVGIMNLRGRIIPVIDLRVLFGLERNDRDDKYRIIVTEIKSNSSGSDKQHCGFLVEEVAEVMRIPQKSIGAVPDYLARQVHHEYMAGMVKLDDQLIILLNLFPIGQDLEKQVMLSVNEQK